MDGPNSSDRFAGLDWGRIATQLDAEGHCLPPSLYTWRPVLYRHLLAIANRWRAQMDMQPALPASFEAFGQLGHQRGQMHPQSHLLHVAQAGHAPLRSYSEGAAVFPLQLVLLLSRPGQDFEGGEFVMTEQRPRMQSRPMVLPLGLGDAAIIATGPRPVRGAAGFYRVHLRHAISRVHRGEWLGVELLLHDAPQATDAGRWL